MAAADRNNKGFEEENKNTGNNQGGNNNQDIGGIGGDNNSDTNGVGGSNNQDIGGIGGSNNQDIGGIGGSDNTESMSEDLKAERMNRINSNTSYTKTTTKKLQDGSTESTVKSWTESPVKPVEIKYGENGSTIEEIAQKLYGKKKAPEHYEELAKALVNKDNFNKDADFGKYRIDLEVGKTNSANLGEYIGSNGLEKKGNVVKYIESFGGNTSGNIKQGIDRGVRSLESKKIFDEGMKALDEKYRDKANDLYSDEFKGILNKLNDGVELTADETNKFGEAKGLFNEIENEIKNVGKSAGYNVDGDIFKELEAGNNNFNVFASNNSTYRSIRGAFNLPVVEGGKTKYSFVDPRNFEINSDGRVISKTVADNNSEPIKDFIADFSGKRDYITAESEFNKQYSGIDNYLEKGSKEFSAITQNSDAEKLYKLHQAGIDSNESTKILNAYASTDNTKIGDEIVNTINSAASVEANKYAISEENIEYLNSNGLKLENNNGKFNISQSSIDLLTDDEKEKYKKLIDSKDVGQEELDDLGKLLNNRVDENDIVKDLGVDSFDKVSKMAKKNYDDFNNLKLDAEYGLDKQTILKESGITDKEIVKEISESKNFDNLSVKAKGALAKNKNVLTEAHMNLGKVSAEDWEEVYKNNGHLFEGIDKTDSKGLSEKFFNFAKGRDGVGAGMKVHMTGADITDPKQAKEFVNNLLKDGEISFEKLDGLFSIEGRDNRGPIGDLMAAAKTGNIDDYLKGKRRDSATNALVNKLEQIQKDFGDSKEFAGSDTISKITKRLKDPKSFTKEQIGQLDATLDNAKDFVDDIKKVGEGGSTGKFGKGLSSIKGNSAVKIGAGIAAAMVIGGIASNASEERRRKREEMNQLIAVQTANMRGGY